MTWCESSPSAWQIAPISLAKPIFSAWNALSAYFVISATRDRAPGRPRPGRPSYSAATTSPLAGSSSPMTVLGGSKKSRTLRALAQELRVDRHAEVHARPRSPDAFSRIGISSVVAGAGQHRAAEHDGVPAVPLAQRVADLLGHPLQVLGGQAAVRRRRRADADQRDLGAGDRLGDVGGGAQRPGRAPPRRSARRCAPRRPAPGPRSTSSTLTGFDVDADRPRARWSARHAADTQPT